MPIHLVHRGQCVFARQLNQTPDVILLASTPAHISTPCDEVLAVQIEQVHVAVAWRIHLEESTMASPAAVAASQESSDGMPAAGHTNSGVVPLCVLGVVGGDGGR